MSEEIRIPKALKNPDYYIHLKEKLKEQQAKVKNEEAIAYEIRGEIETYQQERLKPLVGRFFKTENGDVFLVTGVPVVSYTKASKLFNPYQIPVLMATLARKGSVFGTLIGREIYVEAETVFSRAVDATDPEAKFLSEYTEITKDEFFAAIISDLTGIIDALEEDHG